MPNGVPQSPTWFWRTTSWPSASSTRRERVADDRRAQVADVHLLGDVRRRVVDDHLVALRGQRHAEPRVAGESERLALEEVAREREVDEAGARDLDALARRRCKSSFATTAAATSRGARLSVLPSPIARSAW